MDSTTEKKALLRTRGLLVFVKRLCASRIIFHLPLIALNNMHFCFNNMLTIFCLFCFLQFIKIAKNYTAGKLLQMLQIIDRNIAQL